MSATMRRGQQPCLESRRFSNLDCRRMTASGSSAGLSHRRALQCFNATGASAPALAPSAAIAAVMQDGATLALTEGLTRKRSPMTNHHRLELVGFADTMAHSSLPPRQGLSGVPGRLPGVWSVENLADKARQMGIPVWGFTHRGGASRARPDLRMLSPNMAAPAFCGASFDSRAEEANPLKIYIFSV